MGNQSGCVSTVGTSTREMDVRLWRRVGTGTQLFLLVALLSLVSAIRPQRADAQLSNPGMCSDAILDMMSDGFVFAYMNGAPWCFGVCDQAMGTFFMQVLNSKPLTLDFMECAYNNPELQDVMIRIAGTNGEVLYKMGEIMGIDCDFPASFVQMAEAYAPMKNFFFSVLNDHLYQNLTRALLCEPPAIGRGLGRILQGDAAREIYPARPMWEVLMNLGEPGLNADANELADERLVYGFFRDVESATLFFDALETMGATEQQRVLNLLFLGQTFTRVGEVVHDDAAFFHVYAMTQAFVEGVAPSYDPTLPPDPASANPANALLGRMLQMLVTFDAMGNITGFTPYAQSFFTGIRSAAEIHCEPAAIGMMQFMAGIFPLEMFGMLPPADPSAPAPRDFKTDGRPLSFECPPPSCGPFAPDLCATVDACEGAGLSWCGVGCMPVSACPAGMCSVADPTPCADAAECEGAGHFWCDVACSGTPCEGPGTMEPGPGMMTPPTEMMPAEPEAPMGGSGMTTRPGGACQASPGATPVALVFMLLGLALHGRRRDV